MGGFDERFQSRGGGLANLDFFQNALSIPSLQYVMLLGEGSFHQVHGGVASNAPWSNHPWNEFNAEYMHIRGKPFQRRARRPFFLGTLPQEALHWIRISATRGLEFW